jgi:hypothetical protein
MAKAKLSKDILRIMKEDKKYTDMLEEYDRTGEFPLDKKRREKADQKTEGAEAPSSQHPPSGQK